MASDIRLRIDLASLFSASAEEHIAISLPPLLLSILAKSLALAKELRPIQRSYG